ncbi:SAGA-associated factor 11-like protein [Teratosphaeria destructans]|uniref:SAGA-associated factor 11 n=1 Tax=Teratosphaeria destructans TaxID=418781 RepID=A0A9W7SQI4_9PEZI|nr:SAGA-associated factor 11-like protein [Teratosphaeria destructans]
MASSKQPGLPQIAQQLFTNALENIIHDILITEHRNHKLMINSLDPQTKLPLCDKCKLPRLLDPPLAPKVRGAASDPPKDTQYCDRKPWSRRPGHDIYDNPFPKADATGRPPTKKEREQAKANAKKDGDGTPDEVSQANGTGPPSPSENGDGGGDKDKKLEKGEKKANKIDEKLKKGEYVPWQTCPSCKRSLLITRFAKHLEQCMGLSGRAASRNAMAKINGSTPQGSRGGTPNPSQENAKGEEDEEDDLATKGSGGVRKKLLKKGLNSKLKKDKSLQASANGKPPKALAAKRPPGSVQKSDKTSPSPASVAGDGKRDRDEMLLGEEGDEEDSLHVKKRQKLSRVGSTASMGSQSTALGGEKMERMDSNDGSFVDDGSFVED